MFSRMRSGAKAGRVSLITSCLTGSSRTSRRRVLFVTGRRAYIAFNDATNEFSINERRATMFNVRAYLAALAAILFTALGAFAPAVAGQSATIAAGASADHETLHTGQWTKKSFKSSGTWTIYSEGEKTYVKLSEDFRTRNAPDLKIFLSPLEAKKTNGRNATDGAVLIAPLTSNAGEQIYEIPDGVELASFKSVLIHCEQYSKLWSAADLA